MLVPIISLLLCGAQTQSCKTFGLYDKQNTLTKFFCSDVSLKVVDGSQWNRDSVQAHQAKQLSIVWAVGDQLSLLTKMMGLPRDYMWWLVIADRHGRSSFESLYLPVNNKVMFVEGLDVEGAPVTLNSTAGSERVDKFLIREAYTTAQHIPLKVTTVGSWVEEEEEDDEGGVGVLRSPSLDVYSRRTDLLGLHLRCVAGEWAPATINGPLNPDGSMELLGWIGSVWKTFQEEMNFTSSCRPSTDGEWGTLRDGVWSGMVGDLLKGVADVVVGPLDNTLVRSYDIDFCLQIMNSRYTLVVRRGESVGLSWESYTRGFSRWCWAAVVGILVLEACVLYFITRTSPVERATDVSLGDALILVLGSFTQQGSWMNFNCLSTRVISLTIFFNGVLLYAHYTSALFSSFTLPADVPPFSNLEGLLKDGTYRFGFAKGLSIENRFSESHQGLYWRVWQRLVLPSPSGLVPGDAEGLERARTENYVYMMGWDVFSYLNQGRCDLVNLPASYLSYPSGLAFRKGSPFVEIFSKAILEYWSRGVFTNYIRMWTPITSFSCDNFESKPFSLSHVFTSFLLFTFGVVLSLLFLLMERLVARTRSRVYPNKSRITIVKQRPLASKR